MQVPPGVSLPVMMVNRVLLPGGFEEFQELHDGSQIGSAAADDEAALEALVSGACDRSAAAADDEAAE